MRGGITVKIELDYVKVGDYYLPDLTAEPRPDRSLGKYGLMRLRYLKEYRPIVWAKLVMDGELYAHLLEVEDVANDLLDSMMPGMAKEAGATEELKARDPMRWVGLMNCCKAQVEEIIFAELIYIVNTLEKHQKVRRQRIRRRGEKNRDGVLAKPRNSQWD